MPEDQRKRIEADIVEAIGEKAEFTDDAIARAMRVINSGSRPEPSDGYFIRIPQTIKITFTV